MISRNPNAALKDLEKAKKLDPQNWLTYTYLALLYTAENRLPEALEEINKSIELDDTKSYSYSVKGNILKEMGRSPEWIQACLKSFGIDGTDSLGFTLLMGESGADARDAIIREIESRRTPDNVKGPLYL